MSTLRRSTRTAARNAARAASSSDTMAASPAPSIPTCHGKKKADTDTSSQLSDSEGRPKNDLDTPYEDDEHSKQCCICLEVPHVCELAKIDKCDHKFCFVCIEKWSERENTCPLCKTRFSCIERVNQSKKRKTSPSNSKKNSKRVKNRDQRADLPGSMLQSFFASLNANEMPSGLAQLIFSTVARDGGSRDGNPHNIARFQFMPRTNGSNTYRYTSMSSSRSSGPMPFAAPAGVTLHVSNRLDTGLFAAYAPSASPQQPQSILRRSARFASTNVNATATSSPPSVSLFSIPRSRSYATNEGDTNAGRSSDIPLEINDSDDDDVEVLSPSSYRRRRRRH